MMSLAIWVEGVVSRTTETVYGEALSRGVAEPDIQHNRPLAFIAPGSRLIADCVVGYAHVASVPRQCWRIYPPPPLKPPYLVTDDLGAVAIFCGAVHFEADPQRKRNLPWRPCVPVGADSWSGVAVAHRAGWFGRTYKWTLFAVSSD